jgi:hypothetical protein
MTRARVVLRVEELAERTLPSVSPLVSPPADLLPPVVMPPVPAHALAGHGHGTYKTLVPLPFPDVGMTYLLKGEGVFAGLGKATVRGSFRAPGFIVGGHDQGTLTISAAMGSVTVRLEGFEPAGAAPLTHWFRYTVVKGTGAYRKLADHGTLRLDLHSAVLPPAPGVLVRPNTFDLTI